MVIRRLIAGLSLTMLATQPAAPESIQLEPQHGIFMVPVQINDVIPIPFVLDSGASEVVIPADVLSVLRRTGTVKDSDFIGTGTCVLADGSKISSDRYMLRKMAVGGHVITDVVANVAPVKGDPLLGQSFLSKLPGWTIDNARHALVLPDATLHGVLTLSRGARYEGEYRDGKPHGHGMATLPNGRSYEGEWRNGDFNGRGVATLPNGPRYEGEFVDGFNGHGVVTWTDGARYEGEWRDGYLNGRGVLTWADRRRYEGEFRDGNLSGRGVLTWADGRRYEGKWRNNQPHGRGVGIVSGVTYNGIWRDGCFRDGERHAALVRDPASCP